MYTPQYWHLVVKMSSNLTDLTLDLPADQLPTVLTSSGQDEFTFGRSTPRSADRSTPTPSGQDEFKFGRSTPRSASRSTPHYWHLMVKMTSNLADLPSLLLTSCGQDECIFGRSTPPKTTTIAMHHGVYIMGCIWHPFWILQEKVGISFYFWIIRVVNSHLAL